VSHARAPKRELPITEPGRLRAALRDLDVRERRILELRYGIDEVSTQSLRQIGRRFGISSERVRQIQARALRKLEGNRQMQAGKPVVGAKRVGGAETLPRTALQAWTLELLRHEPGHGYDLLRRLDWPKDELGPRLYRLLRELEDSGLVRSDWADNADGPNAASTSSPPREGASSETTRRSSTDSHKASSASSSTTPKPPVCARWTHAPPALAGGSGAQPARSRDYLSRCSVQILICPDPALKLPPGS